jgi:hypothetical protein
VIDMADNSIKKFMKAQESLRRQVEPLQATMKALQQDSGLRRLIEEANRHHEMMRAAFGPLEELRRAGILQEISALTTLSQETRNLMAHVQKSFRLPQRMTGAWLNARLEA